MKTFRFIGMALFAILMCVNFTSCSSSDDDPTEEKEEDVVANEKKLIEMKLIDNSEEITWTYSYDEKNRVTSIKMIELGIDYTHNSNHTDSITWGDRFIYIEEIEDENDNITLKLANGLVESAKSRYDNLAFAYNSLKRLITFRDENYIDTYTWNNDKLSNITNESGNVIQFSYDDKTCKGYFPLVICLDDIIGDNEFFAAHPDLLGMRTNQLPSKLSSEYYTTDISYTFTNDGYIENCTLKETRVYNGDIWTTTYKFKWQ